MKLGWGKLRLFHLGCSVVSVAEWDFYVSVRSWWTHNFSSMHIWGPRFREPFNLERFKEALLIESS